MAKTVSVYKTKQNLNHFQNPELSVETNVRKIVGQANKINVNVEEARDHQTEHAQLANICDVIYFLRYYDFLDLSDG